MNEKEILSKYIKPLSYNFEDSLGLNDDAAMLKNFKDKNFVVSTDNFIYGVHCPKSLDIKYAIIRAILVAVSDLSAMASNPYCIFLSLTIPKNVDKTFLTKMKKGISKALALTNTHLAGGDICSSRGSISMSVTVIGTANKGKILKRNGASGGELLCVTGNIGDAKIGLDLILQKKVSAEKFLKNYFIRKFILPEIRYKFSNNILDYATSCIDLSDGLLTDVYNLAKNSLCGLTIFYEKIPFSKEAKKMLKNNLYTKKILYNSGDDYELAFSVKEDNLKIVKKIAKRLKVKFSVIGKFEIEKEINIDMKINNTGYSHF